MSSVLRKENPLRRLDWMEHNPKVEESQGKL